jgi:hypothetical protein
VLPGDGLRRLPRPALHVGPHHAAPEADEVRLSIVAPDERKAKVMNEQVRPTFDALEPPLRTVCGFIPYSRLFAEAETVRRYGDQLKPGFPSGIAEYAPDLDEGYRSA